MWRLYLASNNQLVLYYPTSCDDVVGMNKQMPTKDELIAICLANSGEYVPSGHPLSTFATTYSDPFVQAAAGLYKIAKELRPDHPTLELYKILRDANVPPCRGGRISYDQVQYLVKRRIMPLLLKLWAENDTD